VKTVIFIFLLGVLASAAAVAATTGRGQGGDEEQRQASDTQLSGVRIRAKRDVLEQIKKAAAGVRWATSSYDEKGRLVLQSPSNYDSGDFGHLLEAIDPFSQKIEGLQLLGPHGGWVDDKGVEHPDE